MDEHPLSECQNKENSNADMKEKFSHQEFQTCSPEITKRKKDLENSTVTSVLHKRNVNYEWCQTEEGLTITFPVDDIKTELAKDSDVEVTNSSIMVRFPDGRLWAKTLYKEINRDESHVYMKKNKLIIHVQKKVFENWDRLEDASCVDSKPEVFVSSLSPQAVDNQSILTNSPELHSPPTTGGLAEVAVSSSTQLPDIPVSSSTTVFPESPEPSTSSFITEEHIQAEGGGSMEIGNVYPLQHTKHDYIEKDDVFILHIYLKELPKDFVEVQFLEQRVCVKFQTRDPKYHLLHPDTNEDTIFCWIISLKEKIDPVMSKFKVTKTMIEVQLSKKTSGRWGALESPIRKEPVLVSKSDSWISTNRGTSAVFDDLTNVAVSKQNNENSVDASQIEQKENTLQKPTCKVSPMNKHMTELSQVVSPGLTGLDNLGNTCFMNSVLQALANTRELRDYFLDGRFQQELNTSNTLGTGGKLAVSFAVLLKVLWSGKHYSYAPSKLKNLIAIKASQFTGFAQHDAQEFMAFFLDGLHEDLNRIKKKPYTETLDSDGRPDEVVANIAWDMYKTRDNSFVVDLFQGQYKSKLVCPVCGKVSITFDPFLYLSVPLPKKLRCVSVIFMWKEPHRKPVKYTLRLPKDARIEQLKEGLTKKTGVSSRDIRVFEACHGKVVKFFGRRSDLSNVQFNDKIIACEVLSPEVAGEDICEITVIQRTLMPNSYPKRCAACHEICPINAKLKRCAGCFKVGYCDQQCQKQHWHTHKQSCSNTPESVGYPFIISIPESRATFSRLCSLMEAYARYSIDVFQPPVKPEPPKLSQPSSSSLSNSSQSSGSLNSLDSQSSFSSSCTITGNPDQELEDAEADMSEPCSSGDSIVAQAGSTSSVSIPATSSQSSIDSQNLLDSASGGGDSQFSADNEEVDSEESPKSSPLSSVGHLKLAQDSEDNNSALCEQEPSCVNAHTSARKTIPTKPVLGVQSDDVDRPAPLFYIKPVNAEGLGLKGADGERLNDKGDIPCDLTSKPFLSVDWKNNDKLPSYVLVQSKEMDCDDDNSTRIHSYEDGNYLTLDQCLELFTEPEVLSPDEAWYCPKCKEHREATKQMSIWRLPHTLIIQLKRFSFRNFIWRDKIDKFVDFPIRDLDMTKYYIGHGPMNEPPPIYDLYAVTNHMGGILGGHYTAYVRCANAIEHRTSEVGWRLCDDNRVSSITNEKNIATRAAYLLFYRRRNMEVKCPRFLPSSSEESEEEYENSTPHVSQAADQESLDYNELPTLENDKSSTEQFNINSSAIGESNILSNQQSFDKLGYTDMDAVD